MNPYANAAQSASIPEEGNPRETEAWALTEAARRLAAASRGTAEEMRLALRLNWKLWTIFQAELTGRVESGDVSETVVNMLSLCQFVDFHTVGALTEPSDQKLEVLVNINRNIASGLRDSIAREAAESPAPQPQAAPVAEGQANVAAGQAQYQGARPANTPGTADAHTPVSAIA